MRVYNIQGKEFSNLDDLFPEQKYAIYLCDSILKDHGSRQRRLELLYYLDDLKKSDWKEYLDGGVLKSDMPEKVKRKIGEAKRNELINSIQKQLDEL